MIKNGWEKVFEKEEKREYFRELYKFVEDEYKISKCCPKKEEIFASLHYTNYENVKVLILGQDPYHGFGEAHGLSFSVLPGVKRPPSLNNIFKELENDLGIVRKNNCLIDWANQGILLLNSILTVEQDKPLSHQHIGWENFTDEIIKYLNEREKPVIFVLWGSFARSKKKLITNDRHYIIESAHPSPLSAYRGFFGSKPFSKINYYLEKEGMDKINWGDVDIN